jgi:hypothetical protein
MGEAKRRKAAGRIRTVYAEHLVEVLNHEAGAPVWAVGVSAPPRWVEVISAAGQRAGVLDLESDPAGALLVQPYRLVLTALLRHGRPWISMAVLDFCREYPLALHEEIGEVAAQRYDELRGAKTQTPVAHMIAASAWEEGSSVGGYPALHPTFTHRD